MTADALLLCEETIASTPTGKLPPSTTSTATPSVVLPPALGTLAGLGVSPTEVLELRIRRELDGESPRDGRYLETIQVHGMDAAWRAKMCRWMFETGRAFDLTPDCVGCAIHFLDQYLSVHSVDKVMMQLLSMVAMFVASKMHETQPISMEEMELLCENKFTREQMRDMESKLLQVLRWKLNPNVAITFARDLIEFLDTKEPTAALLEPVLALTQVALEDFDSVGFRSSVLGAAAVQLIAKIHDPSLSRAVRRTIAKLDLPVRELVEAFHFLRELYLSHFNPQDTVIAGLVDLVDAHSDGDDRAPSPTAVDEVFGQAKSPSKLSTVCPNSPPAARILFADESLVASPALSTSSKSPFTSPASTASVTYSSPALSSASESPDYSSRATKRARFC